MNIRLIDTHSHVHFPEYETDRDAVLSRMVEKGIATVTIGTTLGTSRSAVAFAEAHEYVWAAVGYHPEHFSSSFAYDGEEDKGEYDINELERIATSSQKVVAIGETGLDFYRIDEGRDPAVAKAAQEGGFRDQIVLAKKLDLALVVHCRDAFERVAEILDEIPASDRPRTIIHCFTGTWTNAAPLLELGCYLSFSGILTFPPRKGTDPEHTLQRVAEQMPLDRILVETDAPFLAPVPHRGQRNEPSYVEEVAKRLGELRGIDLEDICQLTTDNAKAVFQL